MQFMRENITNTDLSRCLWISKGEYKGNRDIERPENSPVDCFQRDGAGRPLETGNRKSRARNDTTRAKETFPR